MPRVSVVIPTFNSAPFIGETLESVRRQTFADFEVIIVDDGSTDETLREAARYATVMDLRILTQPNAGPAAARNRGVRHARGQYCAFIDADDLMLPTRLEEQFDLLQANPELGLAHTDLMTFDAGGLIHLTRRAFSDPCGGWVLDRLLLDNFITTSTVMAPVDRLLEAGLFNEGRRISEDFELWLKMAARWPIGYIDHPLVRYRHRPGSLSNDKWVTALAALEVIEAFWNAHDDYRRAHPRVYRKSLARHFAAAGAAAIQRGNAGVAARYLLRSLQYEAAEPDTWKLLVKAALRRGAARTA